MGETTQTKLIINIVSSKEKEGKTNKQTKAPEKKNDKINSGLQPFQNKKKKSSNMQEPPWLQTVKNRWLKQVEADWDTVFLNPAHHSLQHLDPEANCAPHWHVFMFSSHHTQSGQNQATPEQPDISEQQHRQRFNCCFTL